MALLSSPFSLRTIKFATAALGLAALSACSLFSDPNPRFDPAPLAEYEAQINANVRWSASMGKGAGFAFIPALAGDSVYAATPSGQLSKVNLQTGQVLWTEKVAPKLSAGVGTDGRVVAVGRADGRVVAYDSNGSQLWEAQASSEINVPPAVGDGLVVVRSSDYRIQAFNADNGEMIWSIQRPGPALALKTNIKMEIFDGMVITGMPNGRLMIIDGQTGGVQWEGVVSQSRGSTDLERINDVVGAPVAAGPLLCGSSYQGRIVCFDVSQGGFPVWEQNYSTTTGITSDGQLLFGANQRDVLTAFALNDGTTIWSQDGLRNRKLSGPAAIANVLAVGDYEGYIHFLARSDGRLLGRVRIGSGAVVSPLVATPYGVLAQSGNGNLVLVDIN